jgi:UDPglucose--hexose-1-phosphate uridylyltransferase
VFCGGQEHRTPEEVWALRPGRGEANTPGWLLRVVPNKFPALRIEGELEPSAEGMFDRMNGIGAHEVIVESPDHDAVIEQLPVPHLAEVFRAYRDRINDLAKDPRLEYVMVFKNHGDPAGASLEHTHSQLIATPVVPLMVEEELAGALQHLKLRQRCIWCDIIREERQARTRIVFEHDGFVALAPFAPRFPFETWVLPAAHRSRYEETPAEALTGLATVVARVLGRMRTFLDDPPYNFMLHSAPLRRPALDHFHWHLEIIPKLTRVAGFEWGTGFFINPTPPEEAAKYLRGETPEPPVS